MYDYFHFNQELVVLVTVRLTIVFADAHANQIRTKSFGVNVLLLNEVSAVCNCLNSSSTAPSKVVDDLRL